MPKNFPFYDTNSPTPSTKNTITSVAAGPTVGPITINGISPGGIRDYLLYRNIFPIDRSEIYQQFFDINSNVNGSASIGEPVLDTIVNEGVNRLPTNSDILFFGKSYRDLNNIKNNQFRNVTDDDLKSISFIRKDNTTSINNSNFTFSFGNSYFPLNYTITYPNKPNETIDEYGLLSKTTSAGFKEKVTIQNLYNVTSEQVDISKFIDNKYTSDSFLKSHSNVVKNEGYLNQFGGLNQGGGAGIQAADIIGSLANGQGIGLGSLNNPNPIPNFDIRSSLAGRVLGATGAIADTNLGIIGGKQLALLLVNNAAFNVQQSILGKLNIKENILSLVKGNGLAGFRPNYSITVPETTLGKTLQSVVNVLGFTIPRSYLQPEGSIFSSESGDVENVSRANSMIKNTGKGQFVSLIKQATTNLGGTGEYDKPNVTSFRSGYAPAYANGDDATEVAYNIYAFSNGQGHLIDLLKSDDKTIPNMSIDRDGKLADSGFDSQPNGFKWKGKAGTVNGYNGYFRLLDDFFDDDDNKKSLLVKTQKLFNSVGMKNIISAKGDVVVTDSQIQTTNAGAISRGSAVLGGSNFNIDNGTYVGTTNPNQFGRSWTHYDRYDTVKKLVRNKALDSKIAYRNHIEGSILDDNGYPKIAPYADDMQKDDPKKYMFSIENLAWNDEYFNLLPCERGPGDLLTGKKGRIMWFPPYDIQFSESNSVEWESNKFIGRGESVYTYSNTERSGTLSFKVVVDHPSYANSFSSALGGNGSSPIDNYVASFFAGELDPTTAYSNKLTTVELTDVITQYKPTDKRKLAVNSQTKPANTELKIYFPNDVYTYVPKYENGLENPGTKKIESGNGYTFGIGYMAGQVTSKKTYNDKYNFGLNKELTIYGNSYSGITDPSFIEKLKTELGPDGQCPNCTITIKGYSSSQGTNSANEVLAKKRAETVKELLNGVFTTDDDRKKRLKSEIGGTESVPQCDEDTDNQDGDECKKARFVSIIFGVDYSLNNGPLDSVIVKKTFTTTTKINPFYDECTYFQKLTENDYFVFDSFRDRIKYFHPAFHSTTPEGLNSRLTFLLQCTRQGPTLEDQGANNLAFGRPPVCILRIGDFYNTKIVIDNIGIDYEPLVWDLNPEGIGVQPMIANVNMSFKMIGGSTLMGPINKLQNALSFNYFANTQVYDVRADYLTKKAVTSDKLGGYQIANDATSQYGGNLNKGVKTTIGTPSVYDFNQIKTSLDTTFKIAKFPSSTGAAITGITGINKVDINTIKVSDSETSYIIGVKLDQKNIFDTNGTMLMTEEQYKEFINKNIIITIKGVEDSTYYFESAIEYDSKFQNSINLFFNNYYLGELKTSTGFPYIKYCKSGSYCLKPGNYTLTVRYAGLDIFSKPINLPEIQ